MKKIPSLFMRNYDCEPRGLVRDEFVPGAEWVVAGEGVATRKYDGTCVLVKEGALWRRYDAKNGKTPPAGWVAAMPAPDPKTGHWTGWVAVGDGPGDRWHREAYARQPGLVDGTHELCGPHFQANPEALLEDVLIPHVGAERIDCPRTFDGLREFLRDFPHEGVVWHREPERGTDGDMVKIKRSDFWGTPRNGVRGAA